MNIYDSSIFPKGILRIVVRFLKLYHTVKYNITNGSSNKSVKFKDYQKTRPLGIRPVICYAPFKSMYFGIDGKVIACCLNRTYILGNYPELSVRQIWEGSPIKLLRKSLKRNDLSLGCRNCMQNIECGNNDAVAARQFDTLLSESKYPVMMEFELSSSCNLNCIMCEGIFSGTINENRSIIKETDNVYDEQFLKQLEEFIPHLKKAKFLGGEPFLIPMYYKIWSRIIKINPACIIIIQTNATIFNDKVNELLEKGNIRVSVSIDSFLKENYEAIRINGNFESVMKNIEYFHKHSIKRNYPFSVAICPMKQNWKELPNMIIKCNKNNFLVFFNVVMNPPECSLYYFPIKKLKEVVNCMFLAKIPSKTRIEKRNFFHFNDFINQLKVWIEQKEAAVKSWNYEKQILDKKTMQELIGEIDRILLEYYKERPELTNDYITIKEFSDNYQKATSHFIDDYYFKRSVYKLIRQPIEKIIDELKQLSKENMSELLENIILKSKEEEELIMADME